MAFHGRLRSATLLCCCFGIVATSRGADQKDLLSAFGFQLGRPFTVPECPPRKIGGEIAGYDWPSSGPCFKHMLDGRWSGRFSSPETVTIDWPFMTKPSLTGDDSVLAGIIDGNLESLSIITRGRESQEDDLRVLSDKYGKPTDISRPIVQNGFGAKFKIIKAGWHLDQVVVEFDSAPETLSKGVIEIETIKAYTAIQERMKNASEKTPL